ncbi:hypothetical protein LPB19_16300 [Marinobacter salinisoli]|uniref:Uncharacterized protein n=1 Tax=Marinobacter salinisoli TaxID=2769486 RepID=A0ABX7MTK8_9GAMM|nr:hypothetical protein [Marinobacter salinisoli]QSP94709.1 hypothetical protein LPB19_16300 [Marinobacter salinisoli]
MIHRHSVTDQPLPSALLHNGAETRRQYTRAAIKGMVQRFSRKAQTVQTQAEAAIDMPRMQGSV